MNLFERLYDEQEDVKVQFIGFTTEKARYDFGIVYTNMFFGKPLVVCMQTGRSTLMCAEEAENVEDIMKIFQIHCEDEAKDLSLFFSEKLPTMSFEAQY
ncbi:hypothetical protein BKP37_12465 [Anaerobacillus alkalilacustris]|uniref:DUF3055 domain-containing protein n=1 Tax=Anaerobacillus alkalilacustris TaxID=393763 RepID=A0A1S2LLP6_9BACI|nr:DUF3055 domain-containing protein [Anaerobacillus alkalilacustris]OIJ13306.1 hypothetical protein BKP37_12465 [Anaerobacillus alkalilacustris]